MKKIIICGLVQNELTLISVFNANTVFKPEFGIRVTGVESYPDPFDTDEYITTEDGEYYLDFGGHELTDLPYEILSYKTATDIVEARNIDEFIYRLNDVLRKMIVKDQIEDCLIVVNHDLEKVEIILSEMTIVHLINKIKESR